MKMVRQMRMYCFCYKQNIWWHHTRNRDGISPAPAGKDNSVPAEKLDNKKPSLTLSGKTMRQQNCLLHFSPQHFVCGSSFLHPCKSTQTQR